MEALLVRVWAGAVLALDELADTEDELVLGSGSGPTLGTRQAVVARTTVLTRTGQERGERARFMYVGS